MVDAAIISPPSSARNEGGTRELAMHQTRKGNDGLFGMKAHIAADQDSGLMQTIIGTAANGSDAIVGAALLQDQESNVFASAGRRWADTRDHVTEANWLTAMRPSTRRRWKRQSRIINNRLDCVEQVKAAVRAKDEQPLHTVGNSFGP